MQNITIWPMTQMANESPQSYYHCCLCLLIWGGQRRRVQGMRVDRFCTDTSGWLWSLNHYTDLTPVWYHKPFIKRILSDIINQNNKSTSCLSAVFSRGHRWLCPFLLLLYGVYGTKWEREKSSRVHWKTSSFCPTEKDFMSDSVVIQWWCSFLSAFNRQHNHYRPVV